MYYLRLMALLVVSLWSSQVMACYTQASHLKLCEWQSETPAFKSSPMSMVLRQSEYLNLEKSKPIVKEESGWTGPANQKSILWLIYQRTSVELPLFSALQLKAFLTPSQAQQVESILITYKQPL